jgi:hypothetical protein
MARKGKTMPRTIYQRRAAPLPPPTVHEVAPTRRDAAPDEADWVSLIAPLAGAIGAGATIAVAKERFGVDTEKVALGIGAVGVITASATTGVIKQLAMGAAAVGFGVGLIEVLKILHPRWLFGEKRVESSNEATQPTATRNETGEAAPPPAADPRQTMPPDVVAHVEAIQQKLTEEELDQYNKAITKEPVEVQKRVGETILSLSVDEAVAFVRNSVLKNAKNGKRNGHGRPQPSPG